MYACSGSQPQHNANRESEQPPGQLTANADSQAVDPNLDYSEFSHSNASHVRMPCLICHRRDDNSGRISFPGKSGHAPCIGCHQQQFAGPSSPICSICHTDAESGTMKAFPPLESFGARFSHDRHRGVNCATCHKPSRGGVALSIPDRGNAHATCFQCHSSTANVETMSSCSVCHQSGPALREPESARAFQLSFSHSRHTRAGLSCSSCHTVRGADMSAPVAAMHKAPPRVASCAACHNGKRAFGDNNFDNCRRCHTGNSFRF